MIKQVLLYLESHILAIFLPRQKRRTLRRKYRWFYGKLSVDIAKSVYRQFAAFSRVKDSVEEICFGSSHAQYAYLPKSEGFNLGFGSQDLYTSYELYRRVSDAKRLKRVIIFFSVFSPGFQTENSGYREVFMFFHHFWGIPYRFHEEDYFENRQRQLNDQDATIRTVDSTGYRGECGFGYFMTGMSKGDIKKRVQGHLKNNVRDNGEIEYLERFLSLAEKQGHEVTLVFSPARSDYLSFCPDKQNIFAGAYAILNRHPRVRVIDLFGSSRFSDADFGDSDHPNLAGAKKITEMLRL